MPAVRVRSATVPRASAADPPFHPGRVTALRGLSRPAAACQAAPVHAALTARGLAHRLPDGGRTLYADLDLELHAGRVTAVVGPNGAGKSTLLRHLAGLAAPQAGRVCLGEHDLRGLPARQRARRLAYLPQRTTLAYDLGVRELVLLGRAPYLPAFGAPAASDRAAVDAALARVDLAALADRTVRSLSGGELQRVMLARMLVGEAGVLVLDEPTAALDIGHALAFLGHLLVVTAGKGANQIMKIKKNLGTQVHQGKRKALVQLTRKFKDSDPGSEHWEIEPDSTSVFAVDYGLYCDITCSWGDGKGHKTITEVVYVPNN